MNKIGVQTALAVSDDNPRAGFQMLHDAGFDCVDYNIDMHLPGDKIASGEFTPFFDQPIGAILDFHRPYKAAADAAGIGFSQLHAPFPLYVYGREDINARCYEALDKCLAVCAFLGAPNLIVHPLNLTPRYGHAEEYRVNFEYYKRMIPMAEKYGVTVCLENMFSVVTEHVTEAVCSDFVEAARYIDALNDAAGKELFGFCLDIGHLTLLGKNMRDSINILGSRIKTLHIHDNDGIQDNHAMPFTYARHWGQAPVTDWEGFVEGLRDVRYTGPLSFETFRSLYLTPAEVHPAVLAYIAAVGKYWAKRLAAD